MPSKDCIFCNKRILKKEQCKAVQPRVRLLHEKLTGEVLAETAVAHTNCNEGKRKEYETLNKQQNADKPATRAYRKHTPEPTVKRRKTEADRLPGK